MTAVGALRALVTAGGLAAAGTLGLWAGAAEAQVRVVLELFTSQGCSNCPAADALFADYVDRDDVVALSLPVDYWNYLGWTDTLARKENTDRQRGYALSRGDRQVYTPQIVVSGRDPIIGNDRGAVEAAVAGGGMQVPVEIALTDEAVTLTLGEAAEGTPVRGTVWLILFSQAETVDIGQGENRGRAVTYHNVVLDMRRIAMWKGAGMRVDIPRVEMALDGADGCAVLIQSESRSGLPGAVIGAAKLIYPPGSLLSASSVGR